jgi:hypothetical protein
MVSQSDRDIVDRRLAETLDLFQPTTHQQWTAEEALEKAGQGRVPKSRAYERQKPAFAFRIRSADNDRIAALAEEMDVTRDALAAGLMRAALDAVEQGRLLLTVKRQAVQRRDSMGRLRTWIRMTVGGQWADPAE